VAANGPCGVAATGVAAQKYGGAAPSAYSWRHQRRALNENINGGINESWRGVIGGN